jgi:hypothetical protein
MSARKSFPFFGTSGRPGRPVCVDGIRFPTLTAAARACGVSVVRIHHLCKRAVTDGHGTPQLFSQCYRESGRAALPKSLMKRVRP